MKTEEPRGAFEGPRGSCHSPPGPSSFKAKLAEFAENPICKAALAAGRDFMTARDGRRAEKVLVNGAREKVVEMEGLSREMGEWSLLDEVGDMRGARRELDGHEAPARPLDNQVL